MPLNLKHANERDNVKAERNIARRISEEMATCRKTADECRAKLTALDISPGVGKSDRDRAIALLDGEPATASRDELHKMLGAADLRYDVLRRGQPEQEGKVDQAISEASYRAAREVFPEFHRAALEVDALAIKLLQSCQKFDAMRAEFAAAGYNETQLPGLILNEPVRGRLQRVRAEFESDAEGLGLKLPKAA